MDKLKDLKKWLELKKYASWWGSYPLGSSYIDTRANPNKNIRDFVKFDNKIGLKYPELRGKRENEIIELLNNSEVEE